MISEHFLWVEKYRPRTVEECILPETLKATMRAMVHNGQITNLILTGTSGIGKTTVARALCDETGAEYIVVNGSEERGIDMLRTKIKGFGASISLSGGRKVVIMDEADNLTFDAQMAFRGVIEEFADNCSFIFTCNHIDRMHDSLKSRCAVVTFNIKNSDKANLAILFFKRVCEILTKEGVKFDKSVVAELIKQYLPDYRRILNELQHASHHGEINAGILSKVSDETYQQLFVAIKAKNYAAMRKWAGQNVTNNESTVLMRGIFNRLSDYFETDSIPVAILLLGKYQYQAALAADKEINLMAFLTEVMVECQIK